MGLSIYDVHTKIGFLTPSPLNMRPHEPDPLVDVLMPSEKMTRFRQKFSVSANFPSFSTFQPPKVLMTFFSHLL